jgi:hypothetical protein
MAEVIKVLVDAINQNGKRKGFCDALDGCAAIALSQANAIAGGEDEKTQ